MIIYDIEIKKAIVDKRNPRIEGIEYCEGWHDHANMGISTVCAYDYATSQSRVFCEDNLEDFTSLINRAQCAISFNGIAFDNAVLTHSNIHIPPEKCYDLLVELWVSAGLSRCFVYPTHVGFGLDKTAQINLGANKSGNGAQAPVDWQRGKVGKAIDYCLRDVWLTKGLVDLVMQRGYLLDPRDPTHRLEIRDPRELMTVRG